MRGLSLRNLLSKRLWLDYRLGLGLVVVASAVFTYFMFWLQPFEPWYLEVVLGINGWEVVLLNFLPVLLAAFILYFTTGSLVLSVGVTGFVVVVLSVLNRLKIMFRNDPLSTWDFMLGAEVAVIMRGFSTRLVWGTFGGFGLIVLVVVVVLFFVRTTKMPVVLRIGGLVVCLAVAVVSGRTVFSDEELFGRLYVVGNPDRIHNHFNSKGFLYSFIHIHLTSQITQPDGFNAAQVQRSILYRAEAAQRSMQRMKDYPEADFGQHPHVILILAEAFSELALSPGLTFECGLDPSYNYRRVRGESRHGYIVVPNYAGGTADTEFDILTGINTRHYRGMAFSYMMVTRAFPGLVNIMNAHGFHSQVMHPGYRWFYNRENVFELLGFYNFIGEETFEGALRRGGYISEEATFDRMIERFEDHLQQRPGVPLFEFVITIQNHGPYDQAKHPNYYTVGLVSDPPLSPEDTDLLRTYFYGLADIDRELGRIIDYMAAVNQPVVVIYFSDHMPLVTQDILDIHHLPPTEKAYAMWPYIGDFTVPFIIWQNDAADKLLQRRTPPRVDYTPLMSSFYFGAFVLEHLGLHASDPFMYFLSHLRTKTPVQMEFAYFNAQGERFGYSPAMHDDIRLYKHWSYYRLFNY